MPHEASLDALRPFFPVLLSYVLSFVYLGHLLEQPPPPAAGDARDGRVLWANLHLLFWLSLIPFVTGWMGENIAMARRRPTAWVMLLAAIAYYILQTTIIRSEGDGPGSSLA